MNIRGNHRKIGIGFLAALLSVALMGSSCKSDEYEQREKQQQAKKTQTQNTLEKRNLKEKLRRDEAAAGKEGYVYLMSFGKFVGYYVIKGKISSNGSQLSAEQDITCVYENGDSCVVVDGPQDDGTYGEGDPGIFFFTTEGAMVVTSLEYMYSDKPVPNAVNVPKLNK